MNAFTRELRLADEHRYEGELCEAISGLAGVAAARGADQLAARLLGLAEARSAERHHPAVQEQLDRLVFGPARARVGERAWTEARAAGATWTPDHALVEMTAVVDPALTHGG